MHKLYETRLSLFSSKTNNSKFFYQANVTLKYQDRTSMLDHLIHFKVSSINHLEWISSLTIRYMSYTFLVRCQDSNFLIKLNPRWSTKYELSKKQCIEQRDEKNVTGLFTIRGSYYWEKGRSKSKGLKSKGKSKRKSGWFAHIECFHCGLEGHIKKHCWKLKRKNKNDKGKEKRRMTMIMTQTKLL